MLTLMRSRQVSRVPLVAATILSIALTSGVAPAAARSPTTRYVDDDGMAGRAGCGGTRSVPRKVQHTIKAAGPGDTILVCPGTYTEQLSITGARDGLTLRAVEPWTAVIRTPPTLTSPRSLITIDGVDRVRLLSLRLQARTAPHCDRLHYGVLVRDAHDAQVRSLRIEPLGSDTTGRCGYLTGIAVARGSSAFVGYNLIRDFTHTGIWVYGARTTATVYRNSIRFFHAAEAPDAEQSYSPGGIEAYYGPLVTIRENVIRSEPGPGWPTPVLAEGMYLLLPGDGSIVAGNTVRRTETGISIEGFVLGPGIPQPRAIVRGNVITGGPPGATGLDIATDGSTYYGNRVSGYAYGVSVAAGYHGTRVPTLRGNDFRGNDIVDCTDYGPSANGALSTWIANLGDTSDPPGICSPGP